MMKGAKRFAPSFSAPDTNDSAFQNKRVMGGTNLDAQRAEASQEQSNKKPELDPQRAELSRQHVRALNNQFASWVQLQLKNHPDELWEDGVQDYLTHASNIMEKFSDVVSWLKENAVKGGSLSTTTENKSVPDVKNNDTKSFQGKTGAGIPSFGSSPSPIFSPSSLNSTFGSNPFASSNTGSINTTFSPGSTNLGFNTTGSAFASGNTNLSFSTMGTTFTSSNTSPSFNTKGATSSFTSSGSSTSFAPASTTTGSTTSWGSGLATKSAPFAFGNQASVPVNNNASAEADDDDELPRPSSPSVKKSEEKGVVTVHEVKCKLYVKSTDAADKDSWKDRGTGQLSIKCKEGVSKGSKEAKPTIIVRNDVGKILLNASIYQGIKTSLQKNSIVAIFHTSDDSGNNDNVVARTFLIRTRSEDDRDKLATAIQENAPAS